METTGGDNFCLAVEEADQIAIRDAETGQVVAVVPGVDAQARKRARQIAATAFVSRALQNVVALIGEEDLPDNNGKSGAAVCGQARVAVMMATGRGL